MNKIPMLEKFAAQSLVEPCKCGCCDGEVESVIADTIIKQIKKHFGAV